MNIHIHTYAHAFILTIVLGLLFRVTIGVMNDQQQVVGEGLIWLELPTSLPITKKVRTGTHTELEPGGGS